MISFAYSEKGDVKLSPILFKIKKARWLFVNHRALLFHLNLPLTTSDASSHQGALEALECQGYRLIHPPPLLQSHSRLFDSTR